MKFVVKDSGHPDYDAGPRSVSPRVQEAVIASCVKSGWRATPLQIEFEEGCLVGVYGHLAKTLTSPIQLPGTKTVPGWLALREGLVWAAYRDELVLVFEDELQD